MSERHARSLWFWSPRRKALLAKATPLAERYGNYRSDGNLAEDIAWLLQQESVAGAAEPEPPSDLVQFLAMLSRAGVVYGRDLDGARVTVATGAGEHNQGYPAHTTQFHFDAAGTLRTTLQFSEEA